MSVQADRKTLHRFMLRYQAAHNRPATLREMWAGTEPLERPFSKGTLLWRLTQLGRDKLVRVLAPTVGRSRFTSRCYEAVPDPTLWPLREWVTGVHNLGGGRWAFDIGG